MIFALAAILFGLLPFALLELMLRLLDLGKPGHYTDPFVGFSRIYPLFEPDAKSAEYRTARSRLYFFAPERFAFHKPDRGFRAFCLGGSSVLGHPYSAPTAFSKWLEIELSGMDTARSFEIVNCGGMSYASYRLIPILEEVLQYRPDLIIVMTGHNEFLEDRTYGAVKERSAARVWIEDRLHSLRLVTLLRKGTGAMRGNPGRHRNQTVLKEQVDAKLDHESGYSSYHRDEQWWRGVIEHYRLNLRVMVQLCRRAGVPIVLINPGSNLRDCPPFKSEHRQELSTEELAQWSGFFRAASEVQRHDPAAALTSYRKAQSIDDRYAQLAYRIARCLDRLERYQEASRSYVKAKELDICPLRALEAMNQAVFRVAEETGTRLVDARTLLAQHSPEAIPGYNCYVDQVHPSIASNQLIGQALAQLVEEMELVERSADWKPSDRRRAYRRHLDELGELYLAQGRTRVEWLDTWARRDRLRKDTAPQDARRHLDLGNTQLDFGEREQALAAYQRALETNPALGSRLLDHSLELFRQGRPEPARLLVRLIERHTDQPSLQRDVQLALLVLALELGDSQDAAELYAKVHADLPILREQENPWLTEAADLLAGADDLISADSPPPTSN